MSHTCKNCGVEHDSNFCPECGTPVHVPDPPDPPRHRGYGAVMVAIGVLIGFIVGIGACMVYGVSLGLISFEGGLPAIVIQEAIPASTPTPPASDPATSSVSAAAPMPSNGVHSVSLVSVSLIKDYEGRDALDICYDFTNGSSDAISANLAVVIKPFQTGIQLTPAALIDRPTEDLNSTMVEVKSGITIRCHSYFLARSADDPVDIEALDWDTEALLASGTLTITK